MRVLCEANKGSGLSVRHFEAGYTPSSEFDLKIGKEYVVYGISLWKGIMGYLIEGEAMYPHWYPPELFRITRADLPPHWYFAHFTHDEGFELNAIWGYKELVVSQNHFDALSNLEKDAIEIFLTRKKQTDDVS